MRGRGFQLSGTGTSVKRRLAHKGSTLHKSLSSLLGHRVCFCSDFSLEGLCPWVTPQADTQPEHLPHHPNGGDDARSTMHPTQVSKRGRTTADYNVLTDPASLSGAFALISRILKSQPLATHTLLSLYSAHRGVCYMGGMKGLESLQALHWPMCS